MAMLLGSMRYWVRLHSPLALLGTKILPVRVLSGRLRV
jgi:hypothetical protein